MNFNTLKTWVLMAGLTALVVAIGALVGGKSGLVIALGLALAMNFFSYWFSDKLVIRMAGAREVSEAEAPQLHATVRRLAVHAGIPMPKVYITPDIQPNAFATGRSPKHAAVAVTEGLLRLLGPDELEGVIAHELAHIKNRDILIGSVAAVMAGALTYISYFAFFFTGDEEEDRGPLGLVLMFVAWIIAPLAAMLIQMAISRSREYLADFTGARIAGKPWGLANALLALERGAEAIPMNANQGTAHMYIVNPLSGQRLASLFMTHPPIADRVERLNDMAADTRTLA